MIKYTESHEWINDETGDVGLTQHALDLLGSIVYFEPPEIVSEVEQLNDAAVIESVKAASDIYAPISGKVIWVNDEAMDDPEGITEETKLFKIEITGSSEFYNLSDEESLGE